MRWSFGIPTRSAIVGGPQASALSYLVVNNENAAVSVPWEKDVLHFKIWEELHLSL